MIRNGSITIDIENKRITNGEYFYQFDRSPRTIRFRFFQHLLCSSSGMTEKEMFADLYRDDPNGGPLYGPHVIQVMIGQCRQQGLFDAMNLDLHKAKIAGEMRYWARPKCA